MFKIEVLAINYGAKIQNITYYNNGIFLFVDGENPIMPQCHVIECHGMCNLNEVWRTWRCLRQLEESPSRDGMIPNLEYNKMRYCCLETIKDRVYKNPKDIYAMNDFCFMASYGNITRYSEYMYGNSVGLEQMMLSLE